MWLGVVAWLSCDCLRLGDEWCGLWLGFDSCYRVGLWSGGYEILTGFMGMVVRFLVTLGLGFSGWVMIWV